MFGPHRRGKDGNIHPSEIDRNQFDIVRSRDNHTCQICGTIWCEKDNVFTFEISISDEERTLNNMITVCERCFFEKSNDELDEKAKELKKWNYIERGISVAYAKLAFRNLKQKTRVFAHTGRVLLFRRVLVFFVGCFLATFLFSLLTGIIGGLFFSPQTGIEYFLSVWVFAYKTAQTVAGTPWIIALSAGIGYIVHIIERERYHFNIRMPYTKFEGKDVEISYSKYGLSRPAWQYLGIFSTVALLGGLDWVLISTGTLDNLFGAGVFWIFGTVGSTYLVRPALHQDITEYGLRLRAGPWIAVIRYGAFLGGIGLLTASGMSELIADMPVDLQLMLGYAGALLPPVGDAVAILLPGATGLAYVGRRYLELHSRQVSQVMHGLWQPKTVLETAHNESEPGILSTAKTIPSVLNRPWSPHSNPYLGHEIESIDEEENEQETDVSLDDVRGVFDEHDGVLSITEVAEILGVSRHAAADRLEELEERGELFVPDDDGNGQDQNHDEDEESRSESPSHTETTDSGRSDTRPTPSHDRTYPQEDTPAGDDQTPRSGSETDTSHDYEGGGDTVGSSDTDGTRSQYAQNKELAFDRDDRICQLCGAVGYPKTDLGLVAVPATDDGDTGGTGDSGNTDDGGEYAVENLVTICDTCAQNHDPEELRRQATQLKEWANVDGFTGDAADTGNNYIIDDEDRE